MSLLDKASLIVTPNAYKESKLYSVIPSDGSGDMTVVRATTATRVNSAGLIEVVPRNLFLYSNDFTNANWTKENSSITTSQIGYDGTNNASLLVENSTTNNHFIRQTPSLSGQTTISVYAKANTRNWLYLRGVQSGVPVFGFFNLSNGTLGTIQTNGTGSITSVGNGWYRCSLTIVNFNTGFEVYIGLSTADNVTGYLGNGSSIFIQNSQVENFATASNYFPTTTRVNIPRIDYTNGSCPSLLVEPQRTNLATYSEQFDDASWIKTSATITANTTTSPSGVSNADTLVITSLGSLLKQIISYSAVTGQTITASIFVKNQTTNFLTFGGATPAGTDVYSIETISNGWYRHKVTRTFTTTVVGTVQFIIYNQIGTHFIWGAQLEAGSYPTSYIPTVASTVTRNADVISKTGISSLIGQTEGTLFLDVKALANDNTTRQISISDNSFNNYVRFNFTAATNFGNAALISTGTTQATNDFTLNQTNKNKIAIKYNTNLFEIYLNGVLIHQDLSVNTFSGTTLSSLQFSNPLGGNIWYGNLNSLQFYKTALTNAECITLTTL